MVDSFAGLYGLDLLYRDRPEIGKTDLLDELRTRLGRVDFLAGRLLAFVAHDYPVTSPASPGPTRCATAR